MVHEIVVGRRKEDFKKYGKAGTGYIGKHIVGKGDEAHLTTKILCDLIRPHVILICGKRGCLKGDHLVFTNHGYKRIKNFKEDSDKILSFNLKKMNFEWKPAKLLSYPIEAEKLIKFKIEDGRELIVTKEHPLLVFHNKDLMWKKAENIVEGDLLVVVNHLPEVKNDSESLEIARILGFTLSGNTRMEKRFENRDQYTTLAISTNCSDVLLQIKRDLEKEFGVKIKIKWKKDRSGVIQLANEKIMDKLTDLGISLNNKSRVKMKIPEIVWESSNKFKANFIGALFSCDIHMEKNNEKIIYFTVSQDFAKELQLLLTHFGIESRVEKTGTSYRIDISDHNSLLKFKEKIGFFDKEIAERSLREKFTEKRKRIYLDESLVCLNIVEKNEIKGVKKVYDLQVPDNHSFIANGIISHNSGKSYFGGILAEEIALLPEEYRKNLTAVMIDTMGIYWSMKRPNEEQLNLLHEWNLEPKGLKDTVKVYVPFAQKKEYEKAEIPVDFGVSIEPWKFSGDDWTLAFNLPRTNPQAIALEKIVNKLRDRNGEFLISDMISAIRDDRDIDTHTKDALENMLTVADQWGVFGTEGIRIDDLMKPGLVNVFDVSHLRASGAWSVRNLLVAILSREIYYKRVIARKQEELAKMGEITLKERFPMVWLIIDEAHNFCPSDAITVSTNPILTIVKQGREPGVSFVPMTQMPNKIHQDVISQCDMVFSHRLTSKDDLQALHAVMQTYLMEDIWRYIDSLPRRRGSAIILDDNSERIYSVQVRPRLSWHAGEAAIATT